MRSMTGYGRAEVAGSRIAISVECKSLNHRHLDIALKLPRALSGLELDARRLIQGAVERGRLEVAVGLAAVEGGPLNAVSVNVAQAREYVDAARQLGNELGMAGEPTLPWLLAQPGVLGREDQPPVSSDEGWPLLAEALTRALAALVERRHAEGEALGREIQILHATLHAQIELMGGRVPAALTRRSARLRERVQALVGEMALDESRLATEIAIWAEKTDIGEELARLRAHLDQWSQLLGAGGPVGRTLDFLAQEMGREVNTVGAKADDLELSQAVIAAKSILEKLREQVQNLE